MSREAESTSALIERMRAFEAVRAQLELLERVRGMVVDRPRRRLQQVKR